LQGRLVACEHDSRRVTRQELDGSTTVIANSFQGRRLNRPNDVVVKSDGCIYLTDPWTSPAAPEQWDLTFSGVYRVTPDLGSISLLIDDFVLPNGLAFSPDETVLYINDTRRGHIRAFELLPNGTLAKHTDRVFADLRGDEPGVPDGMKVDVEGNVYCGGAGGIWIMDPQGKQLGRIVHGAPATTNIAFGGDDWKTLYFTSRNHLGSVNVKIAGLPAPAQKRS
jgi:gluconolactonase